MNEIEQIFDNIDQYTDNIDDLVRALKKAGIKDFDQFRTAAREAGVPVKKSIQDSIAKKFANSEEEEYCNVDKYRGSLQGIFGFLS